MFTVIPVIPLMKKQPYWGDHILTVAQRGEHHFILTSKLLLESCETKNDDQKTEMNINTPSDHQILLNLTYWLLWTAMTVFAYLLSILHRLTALFKVKVYSLCFLCQSVNQKPLFLPVTHCHFSYTLIINKNISSQKPSMITSQTLVPWCTCALGKLLTLFMNIWIQ